MRQCDGPPEERDNVGGFGDTYGEKTGKSNLSFPIKTNHALTEVATQTVLADLHRALRDQATA